MEKLSKTAQELISPYFSANDVVIIAPLNWGLGHASRCIPIIEYLISRCKKVIIASDGQSLEILKKEFPKLISENIPSYRIQYRYNSMLLNMLIMLPTIIATIIKEKKHAVKLTKKHHATIILSDNRLGFWSKQTKNIYLTHQINILHRNKIIAWFGSKAHQFFIKKFDICFVPDYFGEKAICPALSNNPLFSPFYLGPISRIKKLEMPVIWDICVVLTGPENQRTYFENKLLNILNPLVDYKILFIRGTDKKSMPRVEPHITVKSVSSSEEMETYLNTSRLLISRCGYSTIMDIYELNIKAILIPTPGQTEQEYLSEILTKRKKFNFLNQNQLHELPAIIIKHLK